MRGHPQRERSPAATEFEDAVAVGEAGAANAGLYAPDARITLWDAHARWTPGKWNLSALYARGTSDDKGELLSRIQAVEAWQATQLPTSAGNSASALSRLPLAAALAKSVAAICPLMPS